nr:unnamed protein product [Digitaria exilis]
MYVRARLLPLWSCACLAPPSPPLERGGELSSSYATQPARLPAGLGAIWVSLAVGCGATRRKAQMARACIRDCVSGGCGVERSGLAEPDEVGRRRSLCLVCAWSQAMGAAAALQAAQGFTVSPHRLPPPHAASPWHRLAGPLLRAFRLAPVAPFALPHRPQSPAFRIAPLPKNRPQSPAPDSPPSTRPPPFPQSNLPDPSEENQRNKPSRLPASGGPEAMASGDGALLLLLSLSAGLRWRRGCRPRTVKPWTT